MSDARGRPRAKPHVPAVSRGRSAVRLRRLGVWLCAVVMVFGAAGVLATILPQPAGANVTGISMSASGSGCRDASTPSGYDDAYACTMTRGSSLRLVGSADSNQRSLTVSWARSGGVRVSQSQGRLQVHVFGVHTTYSRSNTATVTCTSSGTATLTAKDKFDTDRIKVTVTCAPPPAVSISGWDGDTRDGPGHMSDGFTVSPSSASCKASRVSGISATVSVTDRSGSSRAVSVTTAGTGSVSVRVTCSRTGHTTASDTATFTARTQPVTISGFTGRTRNGPGTMTDLITVSPSSASCSASRMSGISATVTVSGAGLSSRTVSVTTTGTGSVTVRITCSRSNYTTATDTATFTSRVQQVAIHGFGGGSRDGPGNINDRFTVSPSDASCTATRLSGISADLDFTDDTSAGRTLSVDTRTATGSLSVRVTCTASGYTAASATATFTARPGVGISGYSGMSRNGAGAMTGTFTVAPADAACTAARVSGISATASVSPSSGADRTVTVTTTGTGTARVKLRCTKTGLAPAVQTETFTARDVNLTVTAAATSGGECTADASPPSGADAAWDCWTGTDRDLTVVVTATATTADLSTAWPASSRTGGVTVAAAQAAALFDEVTARYQRSSTATVACTSDGSARAVTSVGGTAAHTAAFTVDCRPPVTVTGLSGDTRTSATLRDTFTVTPAGAACTASRVSGIAAAVSLTDNSGTTRTVTVTVSGTATGSVTVRVSCTAAGYAPAAATAAFARTDTACSEDLGSLGAGAVSRSGTLAAGCESWNKGNQQSPHHARRYTLTVPTASKLDVAASSSAADVFVQVLTGSGSGAVVVASDDDSGTGTDAALSGVQLAVGTAYTVEVTTSAATVTGAFTLTLTVTPDKPPVKIVGLADSYGIGQATATASDGFTVEPATAACTATPADATVAVGRGAGRTVSLSRAAPFSQKVTVACTATDRSQGTATATLRGHLAVASLAVTGVGCAAATDGTADYQCSVAAGGTLSLTGTAQGPSIGLSLAWAAGVGARIDSHSQARTQVVSPDAVPVVYSRTSSATVSCAEAGTVTLTAAAGAHKRTVTVDVTCEAAAAVACDDPLGALAEGITARSGTIAADRGCVTVNRLSGVSAQRARRYTFHARRHTFALSGPALVSVEVGDDPADRAKLDTYLVLLDGHGTDGKVLGRDDDGGPGTDSRVARKLSAGRYTIEATTWGSGHVGRYRLSVDARYDKQVAIAGLADAAEAGVGAVAVAAGFTVTPATAACTASPATATVTAGRNPSDRTVTADITAPGKLAVTVTCTAAGHADATQTVTLTAELAAGITAIGARVLDGGECKTTAVPDGADAAYACTMAEGASLQAEAEATATTATLAVAWTATGGVTVDSQTQAKAVPVVGPDSTTLHRRTATAALACTANGTATAAARLGASTKKALLTITCLPPVQIHGLADTAAVGTGKVTVDAAFTVTPATAACSAEPDTATITKGTDPEDRTLTASIASPGRLSVTVACTADGRYDAVQPVTLSAAPRCVDDLGMLRPGAVTRTGTIAADTACTSKARRPGSSLVYFARRHTFELARTSYVTVELESSASNSPRLDTYVVLLEGHRPTGAGKVLDRNDDVGADAGTHRTNSRLSGVKLAPGRYTVEATSYSSRRTGSYDLAVSAVTTHGLSTGMHVVAGNKTTFVFGYRPTNARLTVDKHTNAATTLSYAGGSATLTVTSPTAGAYTARLNIAAPRPARPFAAAAQRDSALDAQTSSSDAVAAYQADVPTSIGGTTCKSTQVVVVAGTSTDISVCAEALAGKPTVRRPATDHDPAVDIPASCVKVVAPLGRWHLTTDPWPTRASCVVPVNGADRRAQYYAFRVRDLAAQVTIRLSSEDRDTYVALYKANADPLVNGLNVVDLSRVLAYNDNVFDGVPADKEFRYRERGTTDSRLHLTLSKGVYVIAATTATTTTPTAADRFTLNIKIPATTCPAPAREGTN